MVDANPTKSLQTARASQAIQAGELEIASIVKDRKRIRCHPTALFGTRDMHNFRRSPNIET
jgi:hypothetical protein